MVSFFAAVVSGLINSMFDRLQSRTALLKETEVELHYRLYSIAKAREGPPWQTSKGQQMIVPSQFSAAAGPSCDLDCVKDAQIDWHYQFLGSQQSI